MALESLMQHIRRDPPDSAEWARIGCIGAALSSTDPIVITEQLAKFKTLGGSLRQVGSLALFSDAAQVAQVLVSEFGIHPHDYRSTGGEPGVDARVGYPLLAHLAYMGEEDLMRRALTWGANPDASWKVNRVMGTNQEGAETLSWVGECARRAHHEFLEELLPRCQAPTIDEQDRRLVALRRCIVHGEKDRYRSTTATLELFAPNGPYPLGRSFWDVREDDKKQADKTLGLSLLLGSTHFNSAISTQRHWPAVTAWLEATAPADGVQQTQAGMILAASDANFPRPLPAWCLDTMSDAQVQSVLERGFANAVARSFSDRTSFISKKCGQSLPGHVSCYESLIDRLRSSEDAFPHALLRVVAHLPSAVFQSMPLDLWEAIGVNWPKHLATLDHNPFFIEVMDVIQLRDTAAAQKDTPAQLLAAHRFQALHETAVLSASSGNEAKPSRAMRL